MEARETVKNRKRTVSRLAEITRLHFIVQAALYRTPHHLSQKMRIEIRQNGSTS
jgi:hypothetical protein